MGTWGEGTFENDTAVDSILEVKERGDASTARIALMAVAVADDAGLLDAHICCEALAACEVVAAALGRAPSARENPRIAEAVLDPERSELRMLWSEEDWTPPHWLAVIDDLLRRLGGASPAARRRRRAKRAARDVVETSVTLRTVGLHGGCRTKGL